MKTSSSKSQLVTYRNKAAQNDKPTLATNRRKSQQSQPSKENKIKVNLIKEQINEVDSIKNEQLFNIIETFYNTLCSLPMEMLINSSDPQFWLQQQEETLSQLEGKLRKLCKHKDYEYYHWKLESVSKLLANIAENMNMLQRITHLKGYYSGTDTSNYRSRGNTSNQSEVGNGKGSREDSEKGNKQMISYDHYQIDHKRKPSKLEKTSKSSEIVAQTVQSDQQLSDNEKELMIKSEVFQKKKSQRGRQVPKEGQNANAMNINRIPQSDKLAKRNTKEIELKDKTLTKIPHQKANKSEKTLSNYTLEDRFLEDRIRTGNNAINNSRDFCLKNESNTIDFSKEDCTQRQSLGKQKEQRQFVSMIKELRLQLLNKDKQIERLLINQQENEQALQIMRERQGQKNLQILFLKEAISATNQQKEKHQMEMKKLLEYQDELKDTIKFERERNKKEEKEKDKVEEKYYEEVNCKEELLAEIERLKDENKQCRKNERVMKEKLEVYTKKYFKVYGELQKFKKEQEELLQELSILKASRPKTLSRYQQIREIVEFHKEKFCNESF